MVKMRDFKYTSPKITLLNIEFDYSVLTFASAESMNAGSGTWGAAEDDNEP